MFILGCFGLFRSHIPSIISTGISTNYLSPEPLLLVLPFVLIVFGYYFFARRKLSEGMGAMALFALSILLFGFVFAGPFFVAAPVVVFS
jgi:hypothetical protein